MAPKKNWRPIPLDGGAPKSSRQQPAAGSVEMKFISSSIVGAAIETAVNEHVGDTWTEDSGIVVDDDWVDDEAARMLEVQESINKLEKALEMERQKSDDVDDAVMQSAGVNFQAKMEEAAAAAEHLLADFELSSDHMEFIQRIWSHKKGNILNELCENLRQPSSENREVAERLSLGNLCRVCRRLRDKFSAKMLNPDVQGLLITTACWALYTMTDVDIDRLAGFTCPELPEGMELPADRDHFFREYREEHRGKRNAQMFQKANWAARVSFDELSKEAESPASVSEKQGGRLKTRSITKAKSQYEAVDELDHWVRWLCVLGASARQLPKPVTVSRGLCGLPALLVDKFRERKQGDRIYWAAPSSTTDDEHISWSYSNQVLPVDRNVIFRIHGLTEALELFHLSQYPNEREFLMPPFSELEVQEVIDKGPEVPLVLECTFKGCLMPFDFRQECLHDLRRASEELETQLRREDAERARLEAELAAWRLEESSGRKKEAPPTPAQAPPPPAVVEQPAVGRPAPRPATPVQVELVALEPPAQDPLERTQPVTQQPLQPHPPAAPREGPPNPRRRRSPPPGGPPKQSSPAVQPAAAPVKQKSPLPSPRRKPAATQVLSPPRKRSASSRPRGQGHTAPARKLPPVDNPTRSFMNWGPPSDHKPKEDGKLKTKPLWEPYEIPELRTGNNRCPWDQAWDSTGPEIAGQQRGLSAKPGLNMYRTPFPHQRGRGGVRSVGPGARSKVKLTPLDSPKASLGGGETEEAEASRRQLAEWAMEYARACDMPPSSLSPKSRSPQQAR